MVRSSLVKFLAVTWDAIQNTVSPFPKIFININQNADMDIRIVATILGPTPLLAANFVIFGVIIDRLGVQFSRLSPRSCKREVYCGSRGFITYLFSARYYVFLELCKYFCEELFLFFLAFITFFF